MHLLMEIKESVVQSALIKTQRDWDVPSDSRPPLKVNLMDLLKKLFLENLFPLRCKKEI